MNKQKILSIAEEYFTKVNPGGTKWAFRKIFYGPFIQEKMLNTARQAYASFSPRDETPILQYNDTLLGSGKTGFVITDQKFYYAISSEYAGPDTAGSIPLADINDFYIQVYKMYSEIFINQKKLGSIIQINRAEALVVEDFLGLLRSAPPLVATAINQVSSSSSTAIEDIMDKIKQLKELLDMEAIT